MIPGAVGDPFLTVLVATLAASFVVFSLVWAIHVKIEDAGIVDFAWGGSFALTGWMATAIVGAPSPVQLLVMAMVTAWAARLTAHMVWRHGHMGGEDARYRAMREATGPSFWWRSLFKVYGLQAVVQWLLATPLLVVALDRSGPAAGADMLIAAGAIAFGVGLAVETLADRQLWTFKAVPANRGALMTEGLFAWCRHPNYFGEVLLWWGIGVTVFAATANALAFAGPALLTLLLLKVSGVDLLDAHLARTKPGYADWAARTPAFLPRRPRRPTSPSGRTAPG